MYLNKTDKGRGCNRENNFLGFATHTQQPGTTMRIMPFPAVQRIRPHAHGLSDTPMHGSPRLPRARTAAQPWQHPGCRFPAARLGPPLQGMVPRAVTQLRRPPAVWVLPPSGSLPVTSRGERDRREPKGSTAHRQVKGSAGRKQPLFLQDPASPQRQRHCPVEGLLPLHRVLRVLVTT